MDTLMEVAQIVLENVGGFIQAFVWLIILLIIIGLTKTIQELRLNRKERIDAHVHSVAVYVQLIQMTQLSLEGAGEHEVELFGPQVFAVYELALKHRELRPLGIQALVQMKNLGLGNPKYKAIPFEKYIQSLKTRFI